MLMSLYPGVTGQTLNASQQTSLASIPPVLAITLKRFEYNDYGLARKVTKYIHFPANLILNSKLVGGITKTSSSQEAVNPYSYDLTAIVCHEGNMNSGHYVCYARRGRRNSSSSSSVSTTGLKDSGDNTQWWCFSDVQIRQVTAESVMEKNPYLLFYTQTKRHIQ